MPDAGERFWDILGASDDAAELPAVEWRRRLHRFCENWIFALIIAFGIRHFGVELFRIPSASMEPMLLGDPGFGKGDFVIVDKLTARFRSVQRWDVAVFQYPVPEIESPSGGRARPAISAEGERLDDPLLRPLLGGNFVKRVVVLPGEEFYVQGGDVFLRQDGTWTVAHKPAGLQEHLWQTVYQAGAQPGYRPWAADPGASVDLTGDRMEAKPGGAAIRFTQPLRNLYLKDGAVAVRRAASGAAYVRVDGVGMTRPRFAWDGGEGSIWDLDRWELKRLTSADMDDPSRGTEINRLMQEWTGDLRVGGRVERLDGPLTLELVAQNPGSAVHRRIMLTVQSDGWRLAGEGVAAGLAAQGAQSPVGAAVDLALVDGEVVVRIAGLEVHRSAVAWCDPNLHRPAIVLSGSGSGVIASLRVERDLHYTRKGLLEAAPQAADPDTVLGKLSEQVPAGEARDNQYASLVRLPREVRAQLLRKPADDLTRAEASAAYGSSPELPARAPASGYLMLGDNSPLSLDGREWGFVPAENLRGRGWLVVFPPQRWKVIR